jgi:hypothetical protein|tara:strand:- start:1455 stop:1916 length:462 start_codon:yes stop_codon:yes gene_type:complete
MAKFRYWKLTVEDMEKVTHDESKVLNWDIKCIRGPEENAEFFGVFLYKAGTPHDYEAKKGMTYYYNNIERDELPPITKFIKNKFGGDETEKGERVFLVGSKEIYSGKDIAKFAKELQDEFTINPIITIELHDTTQEKLKDWGYPEAKLLPVPT